MPLMLDDLRAEFASHLGNQPGARFSMDKALAHVATLAYRRGLEDGQTAAEHVARIADERYAALAELVALKAMKDQMSLMLLREEGGMGIDYDRRKPLAWARARALVGQNVQGKRP